MKCQGGGFFPDEVVIQILSRLPIKSLFRARTVCKLWHRLLSEDYFVRLYNEESVRNSMVVVEVSESLDSVPTFICIDRSRGVSEFSLDFLNDRVKVRASCNGLLCCSSIPDKGVHYVCNPVTREFRLIPRRERSMNRFHPDGEPTLVGLACDLHARTFSVVLAGYHRTFGHRPDGTFICFVYDSGSNKWRRIVSFQDDHFTHMSRNQVVFVNGALHWLTGSSSYVLVLDLRYDVWRKMSLPEQVSCGAGTRAYLLELDGGLSIIQISEGWMIIWALKDYEMENWQVVDKISLRCIRGLVPGIFPISQTSEYLFLATHKQVLVYQGKSRVWKEMYSVKNGSMLPLWFSAHAFRSTIFSCK